MKAWQVGVTSVGATSSATLAWRSGGQLRVTVIVKSVFAFAPNDSMRAGPPEDILDADVPGDGNPAASPRAISDRHPFRSKVDVVFLGHAYAPGGRPVKRISARMAIAGGNDKLLDKVIDVIGDRNHPAADPTPFVKMPLGYERAYGGPGFDPNPVGRGFGPNAHTMPNLVYPHGWQRDTEPASLGPIAASSPKRLRLAGPKPLDFLTKTVTEIPPELDVSYFQCAPEDQRIAQLHGGEWILLENLHPTHAQLMTRLPDVRGAAMVFGEDGVDTPIPMRLDTLIIDGEREACIVVCRGSHPVPNEAALDKLRIAASVEINRIPTDWSDAKKRAMSTAQAAPGTALLDPQAPIAFKAPYAIAEPGKTPLPKPVAQVTPGDAAAPVPPPSPGAATFVAPAAAQSSSMPLASLPFFGGGTTPAPAIPGAPFPGSAPAAHVPSPVGYSTVALSSPPHAPPDFNALLGRTAPAAHSPLQQDAMERPLEPLLEQSAHAKPKAGNDAPAASNAPAGNDDAPAVSNAPAPETKEWSWATPLLTNSSSEQQSAPEPRAAQRPAEPPPRAVIYSGFSRKK